LITTLRLLLAVRACWAMFQARNNVRSAPASSALTLVSHRSHNVRTTNRHPCSKGERNGVQRRTKVSFGRTMMRALELLWLAKKHIPGRTDVEIKAAAIAIIELCLSEGISQSVSQSEISVK